MHGDETDVGSILKRTRIQSGYTLDQISQSLNIRLQHLAAIEDSRFGDLPGLPYALGFVKAYANFLGLDDHAVAARYKEEIQLVPGGQRLVFPEPVDEARVPKGTLIAVSLAAALAIYGVWYFVSTYDSVKMVTVPPVPDRLATDSTGPKSIMSSSSQPAPEAMTAEADAAKTATDQPVAPKSAEAKTEPTKAEAPKNEVAKTESAPPPPTPEPAKVAAVQTKTPAVSSEEPIDHEGEDSELPTPPADNVGDDDSAQAVAAAEPPAPVPPPAPATTTASAPAPTVDQAADDAAAPAAPAADEPHVPKVYGAQNADARVVIKADTDSWVQVEAPGEQVLLSRVLQAGDTYRVPDRPGLVMMTGNAGALDVAVDGQSVGSLGPLGAVRRGIPLEPEALEARNTATGN